MASARENPVHIPVMAREAVEALEIRPGGIYVDMTCGFMGHSREILKRMEGRGRLIAIDRDREIQQRGLDMLEPELAAGVRIDWIHDSYANLDAILNRLEIAEIDGAIYDLGANSLHLDLPQRGFSFRHDGPLNMLFDPESDEMTAEQAVNQLSEKELADLIHQYGEERYARRVARAIVDQRKGGPIQTTGELAEIVRRVVRRSKRDRQDPCVRTFQALRIFCNRELEHLLKSLPQALQRLRVNGVVVTLAFHSLEDRICKQVMAQAAGRLTEIHTPPCPEIEFKGRFELLWKKPKTPEEAELQINPRSRSAKLRAIRWVEAEDA